jgi:hypothetical protein
MPWDNSHRASRLTPSHHADSSARHHSHCCIGHSYSGHSGIDESRLKPPTSFIHSQCLQMSREPGPTPNLRNVSPSALFTATGVKVSKGSKGSWPISELACISAFHQPALIAAPAKRSRSSIPKSQKMPNSQKIAKDQKTMSPTKLRRQASPSKLQRKKTSLAQPNILTGIQSSQEWK